jgi:predicted TIM-barrel fold metal-dependent hydrolase
VSSGDPSDSIAIVDTHLHLWNLDEVNYPWLAPGLPKTSLLGDIDPIRRNFLAKDFLAEAAPLGITAAVHVEANPDPADPVSETRWLRSQAAETGFPQAIVAAIALEDPNVASILERHLSAGNVKGVRQSLNWAPDPTKYCDFLPDRMSDPLWRQGFKLLAPLGLSFDLQVYPLQMRAAAELAHAHPETIIVLDHVGMPIERDAERMSQWRSGMRMLAAEDNTAVKISGLGMLFQKWNRESVRPLIMETIEIFGTKRVMFGTNYPIEKLHTGLGEQVSAVKSITAELNPDERLSFFSQNAIRYYRMNSL